MSARRALDSKIVPLRIDVGTESFRAADPTMKAIFERVAILAPSKLPVLVTGESGVGKELVARALHALSPWSRGPFVVVNCGELPPTLIESELFGHERGSFSGAIAPKVGLFESAAGGTLLLDEIGELPLGMQTRLLRVLDRSESRRIGAVRPQPVDVRVVAATNRDLMAEVDATHFRRDLLFRLKGSWIELPPLRARPLDITLLTNDMLRTACERLGRESPSVSAAALFALLRHSWPGNVRELKHAIEHAALLATSTLGVEHLPEEIQASAGKRSAVTDKEGRSSLRTPGTPQFEPINDELRSLERLRMTQALHASGGVVASAARLLRMPRRTFVKKMKRYGIVRAQ